MDFVLCSSFFFFCNNSLGISVCVCVVFLLGSGMSNYTALFPNMYSMNQHHHYHL